MPFQTNIEVGSPFLFIMKKILLILIFAVIAFVGNTATQVLSETVIPTQNVDKVYQDNETGKFYMTFWVGQELKVASISKTELNKYWRCKQLGVSFQVVLQQLKTKQRIVIRC